MENPQRDEGNQPSTRPGSSIIIEAMSIIFPIALLGLVSLAIAVLTGVRAASSDATPAQRSGLWVVAAILAVLALAAGFCAWWLWRFSEEFTF